jgi:hypothetical protein
MSSGTNFPKKWNPIRDEIATFGLGHCIFSARDYAFGVSCRHIYYVPNHQRIETKDQELKSSLSFLSLFLTRSTVTGRNFNTLKTVVLNLIFIHA